MNRPPLLDEEGDELEQDFEDEEGYRELDFDDTSRFDRRLDRDIGDIIEERLDILEDEEAKDELDRQEQEIEEEVYEMEDI